MRIRFLAEILSARGVPVELEALKKLSSKELEQWELVENISKEITSKYHLSLTPLAAQALVEGAGGRILYQGQIDDQSDQGYPVTLLPTLWTCR